MNEIIMQILENKDNLESRVSFRRNGSMSCGVPLPPLLLIDNLSRKSLSYRKLPQEPLNLTIVKLDGSSFGIEVTKFASVADLKEAIEAAFDRMRSKISWPHVWGSFCLCYKGHKLLADNDYIGLYGIKEGDKLQFIRHASINFNLKKSRRETEYLDEEQPRISKAFEAKEQNGDDVNNGGSGESLMYQSDDYDENDDNDQYHHYREDSEYQLNHSDEEYYDKYEHYRGNLDYHSDHNDDKDNEYLFNQGKVRMSDFIATCSSHYRLRSRRFETKNPTHSPKFFTSCLCNFRKFLRFHRKKCN